VQRQNTVAEIAPTKRFPAFLKRSGGHIEFERHRRPATRIQLSRTLYIPARPCARNFCRIGAPTEMATQSKSALNFGSRFSAIKVRRGQSRNLPCGPSRHHFPRHNLRRVTPRFPQFFCSRDYSAPEIRRQFSSLFTRQPVAAISLNRTAQLLCQSTLKGIQLLSRIGGPRFRIHQYEILFNQEARDCSRRSAVAFRIVQKKKTLSLCSTVGVPVETS